MAIELVSAKGQIVSRIMTIAAAVLLGLGASLVPLTAEASVDPLPPGDRIDLYQVDGEPGTAQFLREKGFDVVQHDNGGDKEHVELTAAQADLAGLAKLGLRPEP